MVKRLANAGSSGCLRSCYPPPLRRKPATHHDTVRAIAWQDGRLVLLDQRLLPAVCEHMSLDTPEAAAEAIRSMVVRGAPAIGIAAAYGVVLAARKAYANAREGWRQAIVADCESLRAARPTAVNLGWAIERMRAGFPAVSYTHLTLPTTPYV